MADAKKKFLEVKAIDGGLAFVLGDGQKVTIRYAEFNEEIRFRAMEHGFKQKISDAKSNFSKTDDFDAAFEAMFETAEAMRNGSWNRQSSGTGIVMADLAEAIATVKRTTPEKALVAVKQATDDQRKSWAKNARVAELMAKAKLARLAKLAEESEEEINVPGLDDEPDANADEIQPE